MFATRINVLVVIVLAGFGLALGPPVVRRLQAEARSATTANHLKQMALALHSCNDAHKCLPPAFDRFADLRYPASVHVHLLPFLGQSELYDSFLQNGNGITNASVPCFQSNEDATLNAGAGAQNFAASLRLFADAGYYRYDGKHVPLAAVMPGRANLGCIPSGSSNTIAFATKLSGYSHQFAGAGISIEAGSHYAASPTSPFAAFFGENVATTAAHPSDPDATFQLAPRDSQCRAWPLLAQSFDAQGISVAMADGSMRRVTRQITPATWNHCMNPCDGSVIGTDW